MRTADPSGVGDEEHGEENRPFPREGVRAICRFEPDGELHSGFLLSLSPRGMFLQTRLPLPIGIELAVKVHDLGGESIEVQVQIVYRTYAHRATSTVESGGLGMTILSAPESLHRLLAELASP